MNEADLRTGLNSALAAERLQAEGPNELPRQSGRSFTRILLDVIREPMLALLLVAGAIYLILGSLEDALILLGFAGFSIVITVIQESRTEHALDALRDLTSPRALVIRDGQRVSIPGREVVRGDVIVLSEGDRVPADGWIAGHEGLRADESLLTGESMPVEKRAGGLELPAAMARPGGNDTPFVYSGTLVVRGSAICIATATGPASEIGRIGQILSTLETETPGLRKQIQTLVWWFGGLAAAASLLAIVLYGLLRGSWLEAALAGIALGMSLLPEEFPVVLTIFMAMGAMRMTRRNVLTRRAAAIETLGSATVLCTDKTGTLTQNRMTIARLRLPAGEELATQTDPAASKVDGDFRDLVRIGVLASAVQPVDPMDRAFHDLDKAGSGIGAAPPVADGWAMDRHYPLDPALLAMSQAWRDPAAPDAGWIIAAKGAPEAIAELCRLPQQEREALKLAVDGMADQGLRVLGVAEARITGGSGLPDAQRDFAFAFRGLVGLADPLRPSVPDAVRQCAAAGIRVVMITGDYPQTARAIAAQAGIPDGPVLTGDMVAAMSDAELHERVATVTICARIMPEQKLRLVEALKARGEVVAMTGDGVNDAPSLKAAHIGIAMGGRGTDVAREAAAIVLLDDDFSSIVGAIRLGRRIYDNLRKATGFIVAVHIPIAGLALLPLLTGMPLLLWPIHIAFIEMIIDPVCSLAFEAEREEPDIMERPPRAADSLLFSRWLVVRSLAQGGAVLLLAGSLTAWLWQAGLNAPQLRSGAFLALVLGILCLILLNRTFGASLVSAFNRSNAALGLIAAGVTAVLLSTQLVPSIAGLFRFSPISLPEIAVIAGANIALLIVLEKLEPLWHRKHGLAL